MNRQEIEQKAAELREQLGGKIFAFPSNEDDPFSKYAVTMFTGIGFNTFPDPLTVEEAAAAVLETLEGFEQEGWDSDYERNVRFISHQAQMNAPSVTMRRLKNDSSTHRTVGSKALLQQGVDVMERDDGEEGYFFSARGLIKFSYIMMIDEKNPKSIQFMDGYFKLLAMRKYGKTAATIKQEVRRMSKDEAIRWIERTYARYIPEDAEIWNIMQSLNK